MSHITIGPTSEKSNRSTPVDDVVIQTFDYNNNYWTILEDTESSLKDLEALLHSKTVLEKNGYLLHQPTDVYLKLKKKCLNCRSKIKKNELLFDRYVIEGEEAVIKKFQSWNFRDFYYGVVAATALGLRITPFVDTCGMHPGHLINQQNKLVDGSLQTVKFWSCCTEPVSVDVGCRRFEKHNYTTIETLQHRWKMYPTPIDDCDFYKHKDKRKAVAIDCEMGLTHDGDSELIRLSVIDLFSGKALIDKFVVPHEEIKDYLTRYSGVSHEDMRNAIRQNRYISGRDAAREEVFKFVGVDTIVVVHGGTNDFTSLRWIHPKILDTLIIETKRRCPAVSRNLKSLAYQHLSKQVQVLSKGHDSLEDALAARELAIWYGKQIPVEHAIDYVLDSRDLNAFFGHQMISAVANASCMISATWIDHERLETPDFTHTEYANLEMKHVSEYVKDEETKQNSAYELKGLTQIPSENHLRVECSSNPLPSGSKTTGQYSKENVQYLALSPQSSLRQLEQNGIVNHALCVANELLSQTTLKQSQISHIPASSTSKGLCSSSDKDDLQVYIDNVTGTAPSRRYRRAASIERDILQASRLSLTSKKKV